MTRDDVEPNQGLDTEPLTEEHLINHLSSIKSIGPYQLVERIGAGGMGVVWKAEQRDPVRRDVALKVIRTGLDSKEIIARFDAERQALALMNHPNIARIIDAGTTEDGQPYFAMEFVDGKPLTDYCDEKRLTIDQRLQLFLEVCAGVQHAHQKGIIHRDLKPGNIIVSEVDGIAIPKVIDFGLAKATQSNQRLSDATLNTKIGQILGTLKYMSPEQANVDELDIDTRTDVYALGIILYELLTGGTPLDERSLEGKAVLKVMEIIRDQDPAKPSRHLGNSRIEDLNAITERRRTDSTHLNRVLEGDLDWIVMKSLERDRNRRYESAAGFAEDIRRYLDSEPVIARPPSINYRIRKFVRKNKSGVVAVSAVVLAILAGAILAAVGFVRAENKRVEAEKSLTEANRQRVRAEDRENMAIDAVKSFSEAIINNSELKNDPGLSSLRAALLKKPIEFFRNLRLKLELDDETLPDTMLRLSDASFELGMLNHQIGNIGDALEAFVESNETTAKLIEKEPNNEDLLLDYAAGKTNVANMYVELGETERALELYNEALQVRLEIGKDKPFDGEQELQLAGIYNLLGQLHKMLGETEKALDAYRSAAKIQAKVAEMEPNAADPARDLAGSYTNMGILQSDIGMFDEAMETLEKAKSLQEGLIDDIPDFDEVKTDLADTCYCIGLIAAARGDLERAVAVFDQGVLLQKQVVKKQPTVNEFQEQLAMLYLQLGDAHVALDNNQKALGAFEQAELIRKELVALNPDVTQSQRGLAAVHMTVASFHQKNGEFKLAMEVFEKALGILESLADKNQAQPQLQNDVARAYFSIGSLQLETGDIGNAITWFEKAIQRNKKLVDEYADILHFKEDLDRNYINVGLVHKEVRDYDTAFSYLSDGLRLQKEVVSVEDTRTRGLDTLATAHYNLGLVQAYRLELNNSLLEFTLALEIYKNLDDQSGIENTKFAIAEVKASQEDTKHLADQLSVAQAGQLPKTAEECLDLAEYAFIKKEFPIAALLWQEAIKLQPSLGRDRSRQHLYNAACAASLAASSKGTSEIERLTTPEQYRSMAYGWLETEMNEWTKLFSEQPDQKTFIVENLMTWKTDRDLQDVRDPAELKKLPESEKAQWEQLWQSVEQLLERCKSKDQKTMNIFDAICSSGLI